MKTLSIAITASIVAAILALATVAVNTTYEALAALTIEHGWTIAGIGMTFFTVTIIYHEWVHSRGG